MVATRGKKRKRQTDNANSSKPRQRQPRQPKRQLRQKQQSLSPVSELEPDEKTEQAELHLQSQQIADAQEVSQCPVLWQLFKDHQPTSQFDHLLLIFHSLMVEAGFTAFDSPQEAVAAAGALPPEAPGDSGLPESVAERLRSDDGPAASVSIVYAYRKFSAPSCYALLKVVNAGGLVGCHCGVGRSAGEPPAACATAHFSVGRHVRVDDGGVRLDGMRDLAIRFKDSIAEPARVSIHEFCGLPPPGLSGLPIEMQLRLLRTCDFITVCRLGQVSSRLAALALDNSIWRTQMRRLFGDTDAFQRMRAAELAGRQVNYYEAFKTVHAERTRRLRQVRRFSLQGAELVPLAMMHPRNHLGRRHSLNLLPMGLVEGEQFPDTWSEMEGTFLQHPEDLSIYRFHRSNTNHGL